MKIACIFFCTAVVACFPAFTFPTGERMRIATEMKHAMEAELLDVWYPKDVDSL